MSRRLRAVVCLGATALVVAVGGCGRDDDGGADLTMTPTSGAPRPAVPAAAQLDAQFRSALDPKLPDSVRTGLIQDGEAFRGALPDLYRAIRENPNARYGIVDPVFDNHDGTISATMRLDKDGTGAVVQTLPVHFLALDGTWKLSRQDLCGLLSAGNYRTPACPG